MTQRIRNRPEDIEARRKAEEKVKQDAIKAAPILGVLLLLCAAAGACSSWCHSD